MLLDIKLQFWLRTYRFILLDNVVYNWNIDNIGKKQNFLSNCVVFVATATFLIFKLVFKVVKQHVCTLSLFITLAKLIKQQYEYRRRPSLLTSKIKKSRKRRYLSRDKFTVISPRNTTNFHYKPPAQLRNNNITQQT